MTTHEQQETVTTPSGIDSLPRERRTSRLDLRLTPTEETLIRQAAIGRRQSVTEFMVEAALAATNRAAEEERRVLLVNELFDRLVAELDEPGQAIPALVQLLWESRRFKLPY